jgi:hypothetical protein
MKKYRKFECWLADVNRCLEHPDSAGKDELVMLGYGIYDVGNQLVYDAGRLRLLIVTLKKLRDSRGSGRANFEKQVMKHLWYLTLSACGEWVEAGLAPRSLLTLPEEVPAAQRPAFEFLQELYRYAIDCLTFSRPRDSLSGPRRSVSFLILGGSLRVVELPESVFDEVRRILESARGNTVRGALEFCETYYGLQPDGVPDAMETVLLQMVEKTKSRSNAVGALNVLVECGNISELEALHCIDAWKERNYSADEDA